MKSQFKIAALSAVTVLSAAAMAQATDINIYGASAQFDFWSANARSFVASKCSTVPATATTSTQTITDSAGTTFGVKHLYIQGTGCAAPYTSPLTFRLAGIASGEGPQALQKQNPIFVPNAAANGIANGCSIANGERTMIASIAPTTLGCVAVNAGTTDLSAENINQQVDASVAPALPVISGAGLTVEDTFVVPFAFFANSGVTAGHCVTSTGNNTGAYCTATADCTAIGAATDVCTTKPIDNLTRAQAVALFSGNVTQWSDMGPAFNTNFVKLCMRYPGSGTHGVLDKMVLSAGDKGWGVPGSVGFFQFENNDNTIGFPLARYVKSTGDMKGCLTTDTFLPGNPFPTGSFAGAIGYMDGNDSQAGTNRLKYNGNAVNRAALNGGVYDYYSIGKLYYAPANAAVMAPVAAYTRVAANLTAIGAKANFWSTTPEMKYKRNSDNAYPSKQF